MLWGLEIVWKANWRCTDLGVPSRRYRFYAGTCWKERKKKRKKKLYGVPSSRNLRLQVCSNTIRFYFSCRFKAIWIDWNFTTRAEFFFSNTFFDISYFLFFIYFHSFFYVLSKTQNDFRDWISRILKFFFFDLFYRQPLICTDSARLCTVERQPQRQKLLECLLWHWRPSKFLISFLFQFKEKHF